MKFIGRHLNTIGILLLMTFTGAAAGLYWNVPERLSRAAISKSANAAAACPMHTAKPVAPVEGGCCPKKPAAEAHSGCSRETTDAAGTGCSH